MNSYKIRFLVNGLTRGETIIRAMDTISAKKLLEAQYSGKITYLEIKKI